MSGKWLLTACVAVSLCGANVFAGAGYCEQLPELSSAVVSPTTGNKGAGRAPVPTDGVTHNTQKVSAGAAKSRSAPAADWHNAKLKKSKSTIDMPAQTSLAKAKGTLSVSGTKKSPKSVRSTTSTTKLEVRRSAESYLLNGKLEDSRKQLLSALSVDGADDEKRYALGMVEFLRGLEQLFQDLHRYGLKPLSLHEFRGPLSQLPVSANATPETIRYDNARRIVEVFLAHLTASEKTLSEIKNDAIKLPVHFGMIKLDLDGDGRLQESETLWEVYAELSRSNRATLEKSEKFIIGFDMSDVYWLRGYCHVLMSLCEIYLAHDSREWFNSTAHVFFPRVDSPYAYLSRGKHIHNIGSDNIDIADLIAWVHLIRWNVVEPKRMEASLHHMEQVVALSRVTWKSILAETDDDREWVPSPEQTGVLPGVDVTPEMVAAWGEIMNEVDKILQGKLLIPFWRGDDGRGINFRKVFLEPSTLDAVLWVQGSAAAPYLQQGEKTKGVQWERWRSDFGRHFPGFAAWFN